MKKAILITLVLLIFGIWYTSFERGNSFYQDNNFEIKYSFKRDYTGFVDFPTERWIKIKNKKTGNSKSYKFPTSPVGDFQIDIFIDSFYESNAGEIFNVISFRDHWGVLDLNTESLDKVNHKYVMNKYTSKLHKLISIKKDTFHNIDTSFIFHIDPFNEFDGYTRSYGKLGDKFMELDVLKIKELGAYQLGVVVRINKDLKVFTLREGLISIEELDKWKLGKELEVWVYNENSNLVICKEEIERLRYFLKKNMNKEYKSIRALKEKQNLNGEFINEMFLRVRRNLVKDERISVKQKIEWHEIISNNNFNIKRDTTPFGK